MTNTSLVTRQPLKGAWAVGALIVNAFKLPVLLLYYTISSTRPHPQWSLKQAVAARALRTAIWHFCVLRISTPLILKPSAKESGLLVTIAPSSTPGVYGGVCEDKHIKPTTVCGYWYPSSYNPEKDKGKKIVLHFHGGAFVIGDCRPSESGYAAGLLTQHIGKTLMISYRLSSNAGGRFPAAIQDAVSALHYLLDLEINYSDIVVSGDSAGGNIVVALLRHLAIAGTPDLSAALLWSPWVDLATTLTPETLYQSPRRWTDYIPPEFAIWGANAYCPQDGPASMNDKWISPAAHPFFTRTPIWIEGNGQEILFDQIKKFSDGMKSVEGNKISFYVEETANHDILLVGNVTGFEKEADKAAKAAGDWLNQQ